MESIHTLLLAVKIDTTALEKSFTHTVYQQFLSYMYIPHRNVCTLSPKYSKRMFIAPLIIVTKHLVIAQMTINSKMDK